MSGRGDDGRDVERVKRCGETKPSLANVMVFHQSFERTSGLSSWRERKDEDGKGERRR